MASYPRGHMITWPLTWGHMITWPHMGTFDHMTSHIGVSDHMTSYIGDIWSHDLLYWGHLITWPLIWTHMITWPLIWGQLITWPLIWGHLITWPLFSGTSDHMTTLSRGRPPVSPVSIIQRPLLHDQWLFGVGGRWCGASLGVHALRLGVGVHALELRPGLPGLVQAVRALSSHLDVAGAVHARGVLTLLAFVAHVFLGIPARLAAAELTTAEAGGEEDEQPDEDADPREDLNTERKRWWSTRRS